MDDPFHFLDLRVRAGIEFADILDLTFFASGIIIYRAIKIDQNSMYV